MLGVPNPKSISEDKASNATHPSHPRPMRVCQVTSMHTWDDDRIYQRACLGLARSGIDVHLVATEGAGVDECRVPVVRLTPRKGLRRRLFSSLKAVLGAGRIGADVYQVHDPDLLPWVWLLKQPGVVVIYDVHENYAARAERLPKPIRSVTSRLIREVEKMILRRMDGFVAVTESLAKMLADAKVPSTIVRNTVDAHRLEGVLPDGAAPSKTPVIYTSGTIASDRGCRELVEAMPAVLARFPEARLMFAGRYPGGFDRVLRETAESEGVKDSVVLDGMIAWEDNFKRTARAFCGCVLYARNQNAEVALPNRLFEYMYCGIPVVVEDLPELRQVVDTVGCGVLVDSRDQDSLVQGLGQLLEDRERAQEMGQRGRDAIMGEWGYQADLAKMIIFYRQLLDPGVRPRSI